MPKKLFFACIVLFSLSSSILVMEQSQSEESIEIIQMPDKEFISYVKKQRKEAVNNKSLPGLTFFAEQAGYGHVVLDDLKLLEDFLPQDDESLELTICKWQRNEKLTEERKERYKGKKYYQIVNGLKAEKKAALQQATEIVINNETMYSFMRERLKKAEVQSLILQDLYDLKECEKKAKSAFSFW